MRKNLIRIEYFGGLIINLKNFKRSFVTMSEVIYLKSLELSGSIHTAKLIHKKIFKEEYNSEKQFSMEQELINSCDKKMTVDEAYQIVNMKYNRIKGKKILSFPLEVTIYPTLKCNLECKFCFIKNRKKNIICKEIEFWKKIINECKDMDVLSISILGGEPFLYPDILEILKEIEKNKVITTITTNGTIISNEVLDFISKSLYITPVFSLQSLESLNEELTNVKAEEVLKNIKKFIDKGKKVRVNTVYTYQTDEEIYGLVRYCIKEKIDRYSIGVYNSTNKDNNLKNVKCRKAGKEIDDKIYSYIEEKYKKQVLNYGVEGCMLYTEYPEIQEELKNLSEFERLYFGCRAGGTKVEVYSDGTMLPCIAFENKILKSNEDISISSAWFNSKVFKALRNSKVSDTGCVHCGFNIICNGGCPSERFEFNKITGELLGERDIKCIRSPIKH